MILTGSEITYERSRNRIVIRPFNEKNVQPNSYDVTLSAKMLIYKSSGTIMDVKKPVDDNFSELIISEKDGLVLHPGDFYLGCTNEEIGSDFYVPYIDGKSSIGRLGISVHVTAGRGDVGFKNRWTLEITAAVPIRIYPDITIAQVTFHSVQGEVTPYTGKYSKPVDGPVVSQYWKNFKE